MRMKMKKWFLSALLILSTLFCGMAVACGDEEGKKEPDLPDAPVSDGSELGSYYYDGEGKEILLTLLDDFNVLFTNGGESVLGTYTVSYADEKDSVTIFFGGEEKTEVAAVIQNDVLTFTYESVAYRLLKKVNYTVFFEENGAAAIADASVLNGKTVEEPKNFMRPGHVLLGWYKDADFAERYDFAEEIVTSNITLYARWAEKAEGQSEFLVTYDWNFEGGETLAVETIGGKLYDVPQPTREGYTFAGWWVSMYDDAEKLSYAYEDGYVFKENTTLYALWTEDEDALLVYLNGNRISWTDVGFGSYTYTVTGPNGFEQSGNTLLTNVTVDFASAAEGDYVVTVTTGNQSASVYFVNKALAKVSLFDVVDSALVWEGVENAEKYLITVDCGNPNHTHANKIDNGTATTYNFSDCDMQIGGILFTVEAVADGYATSVSKTFAFERTLAQVDGVAHNDETQEISWNAVPYATGYTLRLTANDKTVEVSAGNKTSYSLKNFDPATFTVEIIATAKGYNASAAATYVYEKTGLATPKSIAFSNLTLSWAKVTGATGYTLSINGKTVFADTESVTIDPEALGLKKGEAYDVCVKANGDGVESLWSDAFQVTYLAMVGTPEYAKNTLSWNAVLGAEGYEVKVNDGEWTAVDGTQATVTLTKAGANQLFVRFVAENFLSEAVEKEVFAYTITFDSRLGEGVDEMYLAVGDGYVLPSANRSGYTFEAWYSSPSVGSGNGTKYAQEGTLEKAYSFVLYAGWTANEYAIVYKYENGQSADGSDTATFDAAFTLEIPEHPDSRFMFAGWYNAAEGYGTQYTDQFGASKFNWRNTETTTLYALWVEVFAFDLLSDGTYAVRRGENVHKLSHLKVPTHYLGAKVSTVEGYAFRQCAHLQSISIPDSVSLIETGTAFFNCTALESIEIYEVEGNHEKPYSAVDGALIYSDPVTNDSTLAVYPMARKGAYVIPEGVTYLPARIFANSLLSEVTIASTVTEIAVNAFVNCANLTKVSFADAKDALSANLTIAEGAFTNCVNLSTFAIPAQYAQFSSAIFANCPVITAFEVSENHLHYSAQEGILCDKNGTEIIFFPMGRTGSYTVGGTFTAIAENAFADCKGLTEITFGENLASIGKNAFKGCVNVETVLFTGPAFIELTIADYAFYGMTALKTVTFETGSKVVSLGKYAFADCGKLEKFDIPASLEQIGNNAFENCSSIAEVNFPENGAALTFGSSAFKNCTALTVVNLSATVTELYADTFKGCTALENIFVDEDNEHYTDEDGVLYNKGVTELLFYSLGRKNETYVIPENITALNDEIFAGNPYLKNIHIHANIASIGESAFENCTALVGLTFENPVAAAVLTVGKSAFAGCTALLSVELPERVTAIPETMFKGCNALVNVKVGDQVTEIGKSAFENCTHLVSVLSSATEEGSALKVNFPSALTKIGETAFKAAALTEISFPENLTEVGEYAFSGNKITALTFPADVTFGSYVFDSNTVLETLTVETGVTAIPNGTFNRCTAFKSVQIPNTVTVIGYNAFYGCTGLTSLTFEDGGEANLEIGTSTATGTTVIGSAFYGCTGLTAVVLPDRTSVLQKQAFQGCTKLKSVTYMEKAEGRLDRIEESAFSGCSVLTTVTIPNTVTFIGNNAFYNCKASGFTKVDFEKDGEAPSKELVLKGSVFGGCSYLTTVNFPARLKSYDANAFQSCSKLTTITVENVADYEEEYFTNGDGMLYKDGGATIVFCPVAKNTAVVIPAYVTHIADNAFNAAKITGLSFAAPADGEEALPLTIGTDKATSTTGAFKGCTSLKSVTLPDRLTYIGAHAFNGAKNSNWKTLEIPANVTFIGNSAFIGNSYLTSLTFAKDGDGNNALTTIDAMAFQNLSVLTTVEIPASVTNIAKGAFQSCSKLASITFASDENLLTVGDDAFKSCSALTSITFPSSVTTIGKAALSSCSKLATVNLPSSLASFDAYDSSVATLAALKEINITNNANFSSANGVLFEGTKLVCYPKMKTDTSYSIPEGTTAIGYYAFYQKTTLQSVTIPASVVSFEKYAFSGCTGLTSVTIENGDGTNLMTIGEGNANGIFNGCTKLTSILIPSRVTSIGEDAFSGCTSLATVDLSAATSLVSIGKNAFNKCKFTSIVIPDSVATIGDSAFASNTALTSVTLPTNEEYTLLSGSLFSGCTALASVEIPSSVVEMGTSVFKNCSALTAITLPKYLPEIGSSVFEGCIALTSIVIPDTVTKIDGSAFKGCKALSSVTMGAGVQTMGSYVFQDCAKLATISLPETLESIGEKAFANTGLTELTLNEGLKTIGAAFISGSKIKSITIPGSVTTMGLSFSKTTNIEEVIFAEGSEPLTIGTTSGSTTAAAFLNATSLTSIVLPDRLAALNKYAFYGCTSLASVTFTRGASEVAIGDYAFQGCTALTTVNFASNVTSIGKYAFKGCTALTQMYLPSELKSIGDYAFQDSTGLVEMLIPGSVESISSNAFRGCTALTAFDVDITNLNFYANNGFLLTTAHSLVAVPANLTEINIPEGTVSIGSAIFFGNKTITKVTMPSTLKSIGTQAFEGCTALETVELNEGLELIAQSAFKGCTALVNISLPESLKEIGAYAFESCTAITTLEVYENVLTVSKYAFRYWKNTQTLYVWIKSHDGRPSGWDSSWKTSCNASVFYGGSASIA